MTINLYNTDCMQALRQMDDNQYDLAIVDVPYGIGEDGKKNHSRGCLAKSKQYTPKKWDRSSPSLEYFYELQRVSKNQIIWGANHFISKIPINSSCWLVWDKLNGRTDFADCELAWSSFKSSVRTFRFRWQGMLQGDMKNKENRIHPTQKPVRLYEWILERYANTGDTILDTHLGSGSIALACHNTGHSLDAYEIDAEYFASASARLHEHQRQIKLFT